MNTYVNTRISAFLFFEFLNRLLFYIFVFEHLCISVILRKQVKFQI